MCTTISSKLLANDYEDLVSNRSSLSFNAEFMKMSNLVSFNPKNNNEVIFFEKIYINYLLFIKKYFFILKYIFFNFYCISQLGILLYF